MILTYSTLHLVRETHLVEYMAHLGRQAHRELDLLLFNSLRPV